MVKHAAILAAAEQMFAEHGYEGTSMDLIASEAGVSKLTVYSHFGDKETLFTEAIRKYCEQQMPSSIFDPAPNIPVRERLLAIARHYFDMVTTPHAVSRFRLMCSSQRLEPRLAKLFWSSGPRRIHAALAELLERRIQAGELVIPEPTRAAEQFFALIRGEIYIKLLVGSADALPDTDTQCAHLEGCVDCFMRAYTPPSRPQGS